MARSQEPSTAPAAEEWYPLTLGASVSNPDAPRYYSLRYEFKPASIDTSRPGSLVKNVENKVTVEFQNILAGKPKVAFQGNSEDCKDIDGVIFFDGKTLRLERLHRFIKSLRHMRQPGESGAAAAASTSTPNSAGLPDRGVEKISLANGPPVSEPRPSSTELRSSPPQVAAKEETKKKSGKGTEPPAKKEAKKKGTKRILEAKGKSGTVISASTPPSAPLSVLAGASAAASPVEEKEEIETSPAHVDIDDEPEDHAKRLKTTVEPVETIDVVDIEEVVEEIVEHESDYELEDVEVSDDEEGDDRSTRDPAAGSGGQAKAGSAEQHQSSGGSSSSSGSSDSGSSSGSGSDDEDDSASSGDDI